MTLDAYIDGNHHQFRLSAWEATYLDTNIGVKWNANRNGLGAQGETNFHGGSGLGVNWYTVRAKNEKDLDDRIQNVFIYVTPTQSPREG